MRKSLLLLALPLLLAGFSSQAATLNKEPLKVTAAGSIYAPATVPLQKSFNDYFALKNALVLTDAVQAKQLAGKLLKTVSQVSIKSLNSNELQVWNTYSNRIKSNVAQIAKSTAIEDQRKLFLMVSTDFVSLAKVASKTEPYYAMHCPMASGNKGGDWLSKEAAVKNPYFGNKMMSCGKVTDTLK